MNTLVLHGPPDISDVRRWGIAAALVVATHVALVAGFVLYTPSVPDAIGTASEPIMLDLESAPPTQEPVQQDIAPGPTMQEAEPPAPEPEKQPEVVEEQIAPTPLQDKAEIVAPPEKPKPKPEPVKKKPKPVVEKPKKPTDTPAPQTTAAPRAAQAARASYNGLL
ncbi:MAG TPA: energy transducer TonB, partial [Afipia sp.]